MSGATFTRCLITGATGFVGSHLAQRLVLAGHDVHIIVRAYSSLAAIADIADKLTIHRLPTEGIATTAAVIGAVNTALPEVVFHLASMFRAEHTSGDIAPMVDANITFTTQLLEGMRLAGSDTIINTGTSWQHYRDSAYDPVNYYAATKQAAQDIVDFYCNAYGFRAITLKLFDTYGPGDTRNKLLNIFRKATDATVPIAFSKGEQQIDMAHNDDVANAYLIAAHQALQSAASNHEQYGVSSGAPLPLREIANRYEAIAGKRLSIAWGERPYRAREVMQTPTLPRVPGWAAAISLDAGLAELINLGRPRPNGDSMCVVPKVTND